MYIIILLLSIWQSILFWDKTPGLSVILFVLPFIIFLIKYLEQKDKIKNKKAKIIAIPILLLSATYFIFNNSFLNSVNKLAIPVLIFLMVIELICDEFTLEKAISNVFAFFFKPIGYVGLVCKNIINKIKRDKSETIRKPKNFKRIIKAILISIPLLLLVFILLITADSDFSKLFVEGFKYIDDIIDKIQISSIVKRLIVILLAFFYMAGFIENIIATNDIERNKKEISKKDSLSIKFILTILNIMYFAFCVIQIRSLFNIYTMNKNNINYSYYARQGFFQLMVVSAINLIMILKSKKKCYNKEKYINIMDLSMIALTTVILISSFIRMYLYQQSYGFTLKRVLVFWAQITEGILLIPTAMYVLDKKLNLARTYFIIIVTMYVGLNFANINRIIAKKNVDIYLKKGSISGSDVYYLTGLGTDAVPETVRLLNLLGDDQQEYIDIIIKGKEEYNLKIENPYDYIYLDNNERFIVNRLKESIDNLNNNKASWQELNVSKIRAKKILKEKLANNQ